jgi:hypothetical protein
MNVATPKYKSQALQLLLLLVRSLLHTEVVEGEMTRVSLRDVMFIALKMEALFHVLKLHSFE